MRVRAVDRSVPGSAPARTIPLRQMRVLIFHGYLLHGTGSNVYNASLARALARLGHEVHLLCQDRDAGSLDWVAGFGRWTDDRLHVEPGVGAAPPGSVT